MPKSAPHLLSRLATELKRRGVYPVVAAYAVVSWIALQIGEVTFGPLGLPDWVMTGLVILAIAGFPVAVALAWYFNITLKGIRRERYSFADAANDARRPSIAVLPFADMSAERDQGYFCEGVAEEILNALTRLGALEVAARSSSFQFPSTAGDARLIGAKLGVSTILEGSVRKSGDQLRVTAQLVDVAGGYHLWSQSFDAQLEDVFSIQDQIASSIAAALLETLTPTQRLAIKTTSSKDVTAYDYYLRGRQFLKRFRKTEIEFARQMFDQAIKRDPDFALAWSGFADCHSLLVMYSDPNPDYRVAAIAASQRALELDPGLAEAHASAGLAFLVGSDFANAEAQFQAAIRRNPSLFEAYYYYARTRFHQGDLEKAAELFQKAAEVDPTDYQSRCLRVQILRGIGKAADAAREAREAITVLEKHLEWNPDDARAFHLGAGSLIAAGEIDRGKRWLKRALEIDPDDSVLLYNVACNFATLNEVDTALDYLEKAIGHGMVSAAWMRNDTDLANLHEHPRFAALLERLQKIEGVVVAPQ